MTNLAFAFDYDYGASKAGIEIPIRMWSGQDRQVQLFAKVDTGAEYCIFQRAYAEQLGIEVEKGEHLPMHTATSRFDTFGHRLNLACFDWVVDSIVYFASDERFPRNVLGLNGWLDRFRFGLVHSESKLYLSHYNDD